jgi:hypothetical protein
MNQPHEQLETKIMEVRIKGKMVPVPSVTIEGQTVLALGKWMRLASVHDEHWLEGEAFKDPAVAIEKLKQQKFPADVFTFSQKLPNVNPRFSYRMDWDNIAAIPLTNYSDWWENRIPQESRKNVRRAGRRGLVVRAAEFNDELIRGITSIYNETPFRQGKPFPKFGMDFNAVKADVSQILDRSQFIGAYHENELVGFVKMIFMGQVAGILSINSLNGHFDKRPTNALVAKAVEIACEKRMTHLCYGRYTYGNKSASPLTEFKRRNGFAKVLLPRYYVPLTLKGRLIVMLNLHRGLIGILPGGCVDFLIKLRALAFKTASNFSKRGTRIENAETDGESPKQAENA